MGEPHVLSALKDKRARIAGEIVQARDLIQRRTEELATRDAVILMFSPDCDPDMIPPIRPAKHGLFFQYRELPRLCLDIMRTAKNPVTLDQLVNRVMTAKGLPIDRRLRRHVYCTCYHTLGRTNAGERSGVS